VTKPLILASGSFIRARILEAAGVPFDIVRPDVDEDAVKAASAKAGLSLRETAQRLADEKALAVKADDDRLVLGSDQIMAFEGRGFDKPGSMKEARDRLLLLQGKSHSLINAVSIARGGAVIHRWLEEPVLTMRAVNAEEIDAYLEAAGSEILLSVGAYQVEALGARLFERIEGDYFAVLGLSLIPVLGYLRREGLLAF
jgi:septum formation protein